MNNFQLRSANLCDTVTRDNRGFPNTLGIYPGAIRLKQIPFIIELKVFAAFAVELESKTVVEFSVVMPRARGMGQLEISERSTYFDVEIPILGMASENAEIAFRWRVRGGRWSKPIVWAILFADDATLLGEEERTAQKALFNAKTRLMELSETGTMQETPK